jgi:hypothetical protein
MSTASMTLEQILSAPFVLRLVNQIKTPVSLFQNFYNMKLGGSAHQQFSGRNVSWDIFNATRRLAKGRAPGSGPATSGQQPMKVATAQAYRMHEKIMLHQDRIFRYRPLGGAVGTVDSGGQKYIASQVKNATQRFRNAREFMVSRMFRGGFSVTVSGQDMLLGELSASGYTFNVESLIPSTNLNQLELGSGANIITEPWDDPNADIITQILNIRAAYERLHGWPAEHFWIDSVTAGDLMYNNNLSQVGGSAYRIWDSLSRREITSEEGIPDNGFDIVFRAMPLVTFHVYDGVLASDVDTPGYDETTAANTAKLVPSNNCIITPAPGDWCGMLDGSEMVAENLWDQGTERFGFHNWSTRVIDPAGWEMKFLDNTLPALFQPNVVSYATIKGF